MILHIIKVIAGFNHRSLKHADDELINNASFAINNYKFAFSQIGTSWTCSPIINNDDGDKNTEK